MQKLLVCALVLGMAMIANAETDNDVGVCSNLDPSSEWSFPGDDPDFWSEPCYEVTIKCLQGATSQGQALTATIYNSQPSIPAVTVTLAPGGTATFHCSWTSVELDQMLEGGGNAGYAVSWTR